MALVHTQPPVKWVLGAIYLGVKQLGHETDHSSPSSAEVNNAGRYTSIPPYICMACAQLSTGSSSWCGT